MLVYGTCEQCQRIGREVENTYHYDSSNQDIRDLALGRSKLIDEVGSQADDGHERQELEAAKSSEGDAEGTELR
jgi:hypothetical protein